MEYWGTYNYYTGLPLPYACCSTTAHLRVGNTPATHEFAANAEKCSASTEIRHNSLSLRQEAVLLDLSLTLLIVLYPEPSPPKFLKHSDRPGGKGHVIPVTTFTMGGLISLRDSAHPLVMGAHNTQM